MKNLAQNKSQKGFTLIELLIVIVIIGILAGIVITILNPARQQNRARDGVIVATMNKIVADVRAYAAADISGALALPTCAQLTSSLNNVVASSIACAGDTGTFLISGVTVGNVGAAAAQTKITYTRSNVAGSQRFCLSAPANDTSSGNDYIGYGWFAAGSDFNIPQRHTASCPTSGIPL